MDELHPRPRSLESAPTMKPHPCLCKTIKWSGAAITALMVALWIASGWWSVKCSAVSGLSSAQMFAGTLVVSCARVNDPTPPASVWQLEQLTKPGLLGWWFGRWHGGANGEWYEIIFVPLWFPVMCASLPTAFAWRLDTLARHRAKHNLCPNCTYDRTGLASSAKCPECGHAPLA